MARGGFRGSRTQRKRTAPHNIADEYEREKHKTELEKHLKKLNEDGTPKKLLTESQLLSVIRGAIREHCWMYAPNKLAFENMETVVDDDPSSRRRWKRQCKECKNWFKKGDVQTDHEFGENSMKSFDEIWDFYLAIANVPFEHMNSLCVPCHDIKSAMQRYGYTKEEAVIFKQVTTWEKDNKKVGDQKSLLKSYGFSDDEISNKEKRREAIWKHIESLN